MAEPEAGQDGNPAQGGGVQLVTLGVDLAGVCPNPLRPLEARGEGAGGSPQVVGGSDQPRGGSNPLGGLTR